MNNEPWLKFIKPAPLDEGESKELRDSIYALINETKEDAERKWDFTEENQRLRSEARNFLDASAALARLPQTFQCNLIKEMITDFQRAAKDREEVAEKYSNLSRSKRGRPVDIPKRFCFVECYTFLNRNNKRVSWGRGGTVPSLASFVWHEATGEEHSIDLWVEVGKRALPWMAQQKAEANRNLLP